MDTVEKMTSKMKLSSQKKYFNTHYEQISATCKC